MKKNQKAKTDPPPQYDHIGKMYDEYSNTATFKQAERYSYLQIVGSLQGLRVLDLACGLGFYTRLAMQCGATNVLGVDISPEMIRIAKDKEKIEQLGITYLEYDVLQLPHLGPFDRITAMYLFNYAKTKEEMVSLFRKAFDNLEREGLLIAMTVNPEFDLRKSNVTKYGGTVKREFLENDRYVVETELHTNPPTPLTFYRWSQSTYEWAIKEAGFQEFSWRPLEVSKEDLEKYGKEYWEDFLDNCLCIGLVGRK